MILNKLQTIEKTINSELSSKIKDSTNEDVKIIYEITKKQHKDQFQHFKNTKEVVKKISNDKIDRYIGKSLRKIEIEQRWTICRCPVRQRRYKRG